MPVLTNRWALLALLFLVRTSASVNFQTIAPLAGRLIDAWGIGYTEIGLLIGLFMFTGMALALPGGMLGRRLGDRATILLGLGAMTAGGLVFATAPVFLVGFAARLVGGAGMVLLNVQLTKTITDWFSQSRLATAMAILMTAWPVGNAVALSSLGFIADATGWRTAAGAAAAYAGLMLLAVWLLFRGPPASARPSAAPTPSPAPRLWAITRAELTLVSLAALVWMLPNVSLIVFLGFTPSLLAAGGMSMAVASMVTGFGSWVALGSVPLGGMLADRTGRTNLSIVLGCVAGTAVMVALASGLSPWLLVVLLGLVAGGWGGPIMTLPNLALTPAGRATGFGVFYTVYYVGVSALVPVAGWLRDATGAPGAPLYYGAALLLLALLPLLAFRLLQRRWPAPPPQPAPEVA